MPVLDAKRDDMASLHLKNLRAFKVQHSGLLHQIFFDTPTK